jgi:uncharacterized RDD family membrane protein YckC
MPTELRYAGFWRRALALITDGLILLPVLAIELAIAGRSIGVAIFSYLVIGGAMVAYPVYFHARWGQTLGKMLAKIKVTRLDGTAIGLEGALLRSSVDIALWAILTGSLVYTLSTWTGSEWSSLGFFDRGREIGERSPANHWSIDWITQVWVWGELLVLLALTRSRTARYPPRVMRYRVREPELHTHLPHRRGLEQERMP